MITAEAISTIIKQRLPVYRWREPTYQVVMLSSLAKIWDAECKRVLDIGGGTGIIAEVISELFPIEKIAAVDVQDRFLPDLKVETSVFDGRKLPFPDASFDCVLFNNVLHHVDAGDRLPLIRECRRVVPTGPIYIKDHLAKSGLDHLRLAVLDGIGNVPFNGMVRASYLNDAAWRSLAEDAGYRIERSQSTKYRHGLMAAAFPNRLELMMKWTPIAEG